MAAAKGLEAANSSEQFDYLIVGAGTAGCVLANRLSADLTTRVGLIEAGPSDRRFLVRIPAAVAAAIGDPDIGWGYTSVPQRQLNNRSIPLPRGRVLGGCSSINGMAYFRGHPRDFDEWAQAGATGWSYEDVLPYFRKAENNETWPESRYHGNGGPMNVLDIARPNPLVKRFLEATSSLGFAHCADFNGPDPEGFGCRQATIRHGRRESMVTAYVDPVAHRQNLTIFTEAMVTSLVIEARKARGVVIERNGARVQLSATRDVILCAGTYGSPQLLLLSGIGAGATLQALGIPVKHDLPGVGESLQDHPSTVLQMKTADPTSYGLSWKALPRGIWNVLEYLVLRRGPLASNVLEATGFVKSRPREDRPDLQIVFMPMLRNPSGSPIPCGHGFGIIPIVVRPQSRGHVRLASPDPHVAPLVDPNYLDDSDDMRIMVEGASLARRILSAPAFQTLRGVEVLPGPDTRDAASWTEYIRSSTVGVHHASSTCRMGKDSFAVVDSDLRVHGIHNLRIADASVFPRVVSGNTNAAVVMVAEKAADLIRAAA
jgi:choline dehydrogenase-like flavoprotein